MLTEEEKKYLSSPRLTVKIHYVELKENYKDDDIFYYYGKGIVISTISNETYIDSNTYTNEKLIELLNDIYKNIDTNELILPEEFITIDMIEKTFSNLNCNIIKINGTNTVGYDQLKAINEYSKIKELKVPSIDKKIANNKFKFKIIPRINNQFTSPRFKDFIIDDILRLKALDIQLPLQEDYVDEKGQTISEKNDLNQVINVLVDIDSLSFTILDNGESSIVQSLDIIHDIEVSIGSQIEDIYYITGNRNIENISLLTEIDVSHKLSIMYDKEIICSLSDFINMRHIINLFIEKITKYELSPLEKTLYAYDLIKDFYIINSKYIQEKKISRYIHRIFKINKLNCQAYATLYEQILKELKIKAATYDLYSPLVAELFLTRDNHSRVMIHLIDEKYNIDGLFSTDVIWDSIKKAKHNYHYEFFLTRVINTKKQFSTDKFHDEIDILLGDKDFAELKEKELSFFQSLLNKDNVVEKDIEKLKIIMVNNISLKTLIYALSNVRVAQGKDKEKIKEELVAIVNRTNHKPEYNNKIFYEDEDLSYLDIAILNKKKYD